MHFILLFRAWYKRKNKKGIIVGYQPEKKQRRRYEQKLYENDQYAMQSQENESRFHYLCLEVWVLVKVTVTVSTEEKSSSSYHEVNYREVCWEWMIKTFCNCCKIFINFIKFVKILHNASWQGSITLVDLHYFIH